VRIQGEQVKEVFARRVILVMKPFLASRKLREGRGTPPYLVMPAKAKAWASRPWTPHLWYCSSDNSGRRGATNLVFRAARSGIRWHCYETV